MEHHEHDAPGFPPHRSCSRRSNTKGMGDDEMGKSINLCILVGNIGKDPEIKVTQSGFSIASFSVACNFRKKDERDEWVDAVEWVPVKAFGKTAEAVGKYLRKGAKVAVEGRFVTESWEDKEGGKRYRSQVNAEEVVFLDSKADNAGRAPASTPRRDDPPRDDVQPDLLGDDIPF